MFTNKKVSEIEIIKNKNINELKILLAIETTAMLHGKAAAKKVLKLLKKHLQQDLLVTTYPL